MVTICVAMKGWFENSNEKDIQSPLMSLLENLGLRFCNIFVAMIRFPNIVRLDFHV